MRKSLLLLLTLLFCLTGWADIRVTNLSVEGRKDQPLGLDVIAPRLGWQLQADDDAENVLQTAYHIQVASDSILLLQDKPDLWDSQVTSDQSLYIPYGGRELKPNQRCFWRVKVTGTFRKQNRTNVISSGEKSSTFDTGWSAISSWGMGLLNESHWKGRWIGYDHANAWDIEEEHSRLSARYFRHDFEIKKPVRRATLHICGLGVFDAFINGEKISEDVMASAPTDFDRSIIYSTYDVTLREGGNRLSATVSNGRYYAMQQGKKKYKINTFGYPKLRANLIIEYADGKTETIATDERTWQICCDGPIRSSNEYDGEIYDARKESALLDDNNWTSPERCEIPRGELIGNVTPNMRIVDSLAVAETEYLPNGDVLLDFGQNFAGWTRVRLDRMQLHEGDTLRLQYAERLDKEGNLYTENLRHAQSTDYYIANGKESMHECYWSPRFATHGGRYVQVAVSAPNGSHKNLQKVLAKTSKTEKKAQDHTATFLGQVISDPMEKLYTFESENPLLNRLMEMSYWGVLSNYKGMPIDCPQRDERMPWLGDRAMGCWGESFLMDNHHLYNKWLRDIEESQRADGCIPDVAPAYWNYYSDNVSWPSVFVFGAEMLYQQFGNNKAIREHYPAMRKWLEHFWRDKRNSKTGLIHADKYGDWCVTPESPELIHSEDPSRITDGDLIASCYMYKLLGTMMRFDSILLAQPLSMEMQRRGLGKEVLDADCQEFGDMRQQLRDAINREYLHEASGSAPKIGKNQEEHYLYPDSTHYANGSLTANLLPLAFGIVPDSLEETITRQVVAKILLKPADGHLCCGVIGIQWLLRELSKRGRMDVAYLLATNKTFPSWGYMAENGTTTIWELWNGDTANPKMNSGNHVMLLGDLIPWMMEDLGGIRPLEPGFKKIRLAPPFELEECGSHSTSYETPYGKVVSKWHRIADGKIHWEFEIPVNTTAEVVVFGKTHLYGSGKHAIYASPNDRESVSASGINAKVLQNQFLYTQADFPSCHAATIAECSNGDLLAAYFGGSYESAPDVCIWTQRKRLVRAASKNDPFHVYAKGWSAPELVVDGSLTDDHVTKFTPTQNASADTLRKACYNPVLYQIPGGDLLLFYKVGRNVKDWTGYLMRSQDCGKTWSQPEQLPDSILGAIKNKPLLLPKGFICKDGSVLQQDRILSPSSKEDGTWRCYIEMSEDDGRSWSLVGPIAEDRTKIRTIQPALLKHADGRLQMLCRTAVPKPELGEAYARVATSYSDDGGMTWSPMELVEDLPNNNSGIDATRLDDSISGSQPGRGASQLFAVVYNAFSCLDFRDKKDPAYTKPVRNPLNIATSNDGTNWEPLITLEDSPISQYSYPSMLQGSDGSLHVIYTWRRQRIKYQRLNITKQDKSTTGNIIIHQY